MASKKVPSIADAVLGFKNVMSRIGLQEYTYLNHVIQSKTAKNFSVLIIPENALWDALIDDPEINLTELDISKPENTDAREKMYYGEELSRSNEGWIEMDPESLQKGDIINISIPGFTHEIPINKTLFVLRFKKAELNNFAYKVYSSPRLALVIKKKFEGPVPESGFYLARAFQIV